MNIPSIVQKALQSIKTGEYLARRSWLIVKYDGKDISEDISKYFLSTSYTDNLGGKVDDITITLEDRAELWTNEWFPDQGAKFDLTIATYNWTNLQEGYKEFHLGVFEMDQLEGSNSPSKVQIKCVSATISEYSTLRGVKRDHKWEDISLWKVANDIAYQNKLGLFWDCSDNPNIKATEQKKESDLNFLKKLCKDNGCSLKIANDKIIIFDEQRYEAKEPTITIHHPPRIPDNEQDNLLHYDQTTGYNFTFKSRDIYKTCHVQYQNTKDKQTIEAIFTDPNRSKGPTLEINQQVDSVAEAQILAKKKLREKNKEEIVFSYHCPGNFNLVAGITVNITGFGKLDGKYIITKSTHDISDTYRTSVNMRRCLNGY